MTVKLRIAEIGQSDFDEWLVLWNECNRGTCPPDVTQQTWTRLLDPVFPVFGLTARTENRIAAILHYVLHPVTGNAKDVCYMQDLYVAVPLRRRGIASALVSALEATGKRQGWSRIYWLAESGNAPAQALYRALGVKLDFSLHILPLSA